MIRSRTTCTAVVALIGVVGCGPAARPAGAPAPTSPATAVAAAPATAATVAPAPDTPKAVAPLHMSATTLPVRPLIERRAHSQRLNFDLMLRNQGTTVAEIARIELWVKDRAGKLALRRFIDASGFQPAVSTAGKTR